MSAEDGEGLRGEAPASSPEAWRVQSSEQLADCRVFKVRRDLSADPRGGRVHDFYVIEAPDWINVIPLTDAGEVVLVEQYRQGTREVSLEIPGGMVEPGESPRETAAREMLEETGYAAEELVPLGRTRPNPAIQDNWLYTFLARGATRRQEPRAGGTEHTVVRLAPVERIPALVAGGAITHALVVAAFYRLWLCERGVVAAAPALPVPEAPAENGNSARPKGRRVEVWRLSAGRSCFIEPCESNWSSWRTRARATRATRPTSGSSRYATNSTRCSRAR